MAVVPQAAQETVGRTATSSGGSTAVGAAVGGPARRRERRRRRRRLCERAPELSRVVEVRIVWLEGLDVVAEHQERAIDQTLLAK